MKQFPEQKPQPKLKFSLPHFVKKSQFLKYSAGAAVLIGGFFLTESTGLTSFAGGTEYTKEKIELSALPVVQPTIRYGFALDTFHVQEKKVESGDIFHQLLMKYGKMTYVKADSLQKAASAFYNFNIIQNGKPYVVLSKQNNAVADYLIYEPDQKRYIIFDLRSSTPSVSEVKYPLEAREFEASGKVKGSLWSTMVADGMSYALTDMVEDALKHQIDLRQFEDGDEYKLIWEEEFVEGRSVAVKTLKAAYFRDMDGEKPIYAIWYDNGKEKGWYSRDGMAMKDGFLKSPLKYANITSHYNLKRLHPILGYVRPHFGTDYAAPHGTPILSVADGVVTEARNGGGNGNYVKIRHVKPYETQYLHMSRFAKGIKPGTHVQQGQVIGYVGSTGLATGPHVCFRFWKNGTQVNHLKEKLPMVSSFSSEDRKQFKTLAENFIARLEKVPFLTEAEMQERKKKFEAMRAKP